MNNRRSLIKFVEPFLTESFYKYHLTKTPHIFGEENEHIVEFDLPGYTKENVKVTVEDNILKIKGELKTQRKNDSFIKEYILNDKFDKSNITAEVKNGVLTIKIPHRKSEERLIEII